MAIFSYAELKMSSGHHVPKITNSLIGANSRKIYVVNQRISKLIDQVKLTLSRNILINSLLIDKYIGLTLNDKIEEIGSNCFPNK
jgi:hypothetical protein